VDPADRSRCVPRPSPFRGYSERPERFEFRLTQKGRDLQIALTGLRQWGDKYVSERPPALLRRKADRKPVVAALVPKASEHLRLEDVELVPRPGGPPRTRAGTGPL